MTVVLGQIYDKSIARDCPTLCGTADAAAPVHLARPRKACDAHDDHAGLESAPEPRTEAETERQAQTQSKVS